MRAKKEITLVGAGLVGCLLSIYLSRRGFSVKIFESRPDMRRHTIPAGRSINLSLSERGIHALKEVGLYRNIEKHLIEMPGRMLHDKNGVLQYQAYGRNPGDVHYSVSRAVLNKILLDAAESTARASNSLMVKSVGPLASSAVIRTLQAKKSSTTTPPRLEIKQPAGIRILKGTGSIPPTSSQPIKTSSSKAMVPPVSLALKVGLILQRSKSGHEILTNFSCVALNPIKVSNAT